GFGRPEEGGTARGQKRIAPHEPVKTRTRAGAVIPCSAATDTPPSPPRCAMRPPVILAIDQGTTSSRAVIYDAATFAVLGSAQQEIGQHYPKDGWVEHEPEDIWYSVARTVREALTKAGRQPSDVLTVGI